jgi:hypothetical protein
MRSVTWLIQYYLYQSDNATGTRFDLQCVPAHTDFAINAYLTLRMYSCTLSSYQI